MRRPRLGTDYGETLTELLVAVMVLGTAVVAVLGGLATSILLSDVHRRQAEATTYLRAFAASVEATVARVPTGYLDCSGGSAYEAAYTLPSGSGMNRRVVDVRFWDGAAFTGSCSAGNDRGLQRVTLEVSGPRATVTMDIVIRRPCRPTDPPCD